ncbi:tetratricopeptide repeat protein [Bartonella sp. HY761]|uniref:tetratricopeptide repeat protein n=1 Tax=Bartonella sp. HY761 TaxID=2979330 RepID=UPI0021E26672|nr:hypothetical protein [Bartonella sp. HY761]UXN07930.1 hypothetical protein N6A79_15080 [Bartonella sp. HY761]
MVQKTAKQDDPMGEAVLGWLYYTGQGVEANTVLAARYYRRALNQQSTLVEFNFGLVIQYGLVQLDASISPFHRVSAGDLPLIEGVELYRKAAAKGHAKALYQLGPLHENGPFFTLNMKKAIKYYEKAAAQNIIEAKQRLQFIQGNNLVNLGFFKHYAQTWKQAELGGTMPDDLTIFII